MPCGHFDKEILKVHERIHKNITLTNIEATFIMDK